MSELEKFLGDEYKPEKGKDNRLLYQQEIWEQDKGRQHYLAFVREVMTGRGNGKVLVYGSGWAGFELQDWGFKSDFATPDEFLKWQLERRGLELELDEHYPLAVALDELLRHKDPLALVDEMTTSAKIVIFNVNERWPVIKNETYPVNVDKLIAKIKSKYTVLIYKQYDHYAHLFAVKGTERKEEANVERKQDSGPGVKPESVGR